MNVYAPAERLTSLCDCVAFKRSAAPLNFLNGAKHLSTYSCALRVIGLAVPLDVEDAVFEEFIRNL